MESNKAKVAKEVTETELASERLMDKKKYQAPQLVEWGSVADLTSSGPSGGEDADGLGSVT